MTLEELPPVLVLHLKRFIFEKTGGCQKLTKNIDYPVDLEISKGTDPHSVEHTRLLTWPMDSLCTHNTVVSSSIVHNFQYSLLENST